MTDKPPLDPRNFRPAFDVERENKAMELDEGMRNCVGYKNDGSVCGAELPRGLRLYCSGECTGNAKKWGEYRHD
jgi:hypothetical protein